MNATSESKFKVRSNFTPQKLGHVNATKCQHKHKLCFLRDATSKVKIKLGKQLSVQESLL